MSLKKNVILEVLFTSVVVVVSDQWMKSWSWVHVGIYERRSLWGLPGLYLTRILNRGMVGEEFSALPQGEIETYTRYLPTALEILLFGLFMIRLRDSTSLSKRELFGYALLLSGGVSNLLNQWTSEFVVDTFQIHMGGGLYLPFNFADAGIVAGALFLAGALLPLVLPYRFQSGQ